VSAIPSIAALCRARDQRRYDITDNSFVQAQLNGTRARRKMPPSTATRSP